ncbi:MAG: STAS domain-containing protein [Spirochaetes bacterium]|nr:STAS domain-containing protein [Spirochaetota bacterium]
MKELRLSPNCGIQNVRGLYDEALDAARAGMGVAVDCGEIRRIDCSVAQVLLALRIECEGRRAAFTVRSANDVMARLLKFAGIQ